MPIHAAALEELRKQATAAGLQTRFAGEGVLVIAAPDEPPPEKSAASAAPLTSG